LRFLFFFTGENILEDSIFSFCKVLLLEIINLLKKKKIKISNIFENNIISVKAAKVVG
jgi:hypothetical protein